MQAYYCNLVVYFCAVHNFVALGQYGMPQAWQSGQQQPNQPQQPWGPQQPQQPQQSLQPPQSQEQWQPQQTNQPEQPNPPWQPQQPEQPQQQPNPSWQPEQPQQQPNPPWQPQTPSSGQFAPPQPQSSSPPAPGNPFLGFLGSAQSQGVGNNLLLETRFICPPFQPPELKYTVWDDCAQKVKDALTKEKVDYRSTEQILIDAGYKIKIYKAVTKDGYIITLFRIVDSPNWDDRTRFARKTPVYVNHGLTCSTDFWFFQPMGRNLPSMMIDAGFDVWMSNSRGNSYSREHLYLDADRDWQQYWDYSFHEMAIYDLPAVTDLIIQTTGIPKILYVGYSMGTTQAFMGLAELPELNQKFEATFLIAPTAYQGHSYNIARYLAQFLHSYEAYLPINALARGKLSTAKEIKQLLGFDSVDICLPAVARCGVCDNIFFLLFGFNPNQMNYTNIPTLMARSPNSGSFKLFSHYAQHMVSCRFAQYNYGPLLNQQKYGSVEPPEYRLGDITSPQYYYCAPRDNFGTPADMEMVVSKLKPGVLREYYWVPDENFNHMDFALAIDADKLAFNKIISDMNQYKRFY